MIMAGGVTMPGTDWTHVSVRVPVAGAAKPVKEAVAEVVETVVVGLEVAGVASVAVAEADKA